MQNIIVIWSGAVVDIPAGWALCDGNNNTPDLRDKIVVGAGLTYAVDAVTPTNIVADSALSLHALCYIMKVP